MNQEFSFSIYLRFKENISFAFQNPPLFVKYRYNCFPLRIYIIDNKEKFKNVNLNTLLLVIVLFLFFFFLICRKYDEIWERETWDLESGMRANPESPEALHLMTVGFGEGAPALSIPISKAVAICHSQLFARIKQYNSSMQPSRTYTICTIIVGLLSFFIRA